MNKLKMIILTLTCFSVWSQDKSVKTATNINSYLIETKWFQITRLTTDSQTVEITFDKPFYHIYQPIDVYPCPKTPKYSIKDLTLTFYPVPDCTEAFQKQTTCNINFQSLHPFFSTAIECEGDLSFFDIKSLRPNGTKISSLGIENVESFRKDFKVISNLKRRRFPDRNSEIIYCDERNSGMWMKFIPKGAIFHAFARTSEKDTIDGIEDYWYFGFPTFSSFPGIIYTVESDNWTNSKCAINGEFRKDIDQDLLFNYWVFGGYLK